jgi:hypothetical protein
VAVGIACCSGLILGDRPKLPWFHLPTLYKLTGEDPILKIVTIALVAALPILFGSAEAKAQSTRMMTGGSSGTCPAGTCSGKGGTFAKDVKNCTAANCAKAKGKSVGKAG